MARYFLFLFLMGWMTIVQGQQSNNVSLLGNWDDNSLPTISGVQYNDIWGYAADGKEFAIVGSQQKIHFMDVTNPSQIIEIAAIAGGNNAIWRDMKTYGTHAYSVADQGSEGLLVFDLSNITNSTNPSVTLVDQQNSVFSRAHNIYIDTDHGFLYVAGASTSGNSDLLIYDLNTTPESPTLLQSVDLPGNYIHDIYVKDHIAYCSHEGRGLFIYNLCGITEPSCSDGINGTFVELGRIDTYQFQGYNHSSWVKGNTIVFADETHGSPLTSADISDFEEIEITDYFQSNKLGVSNPTSSSGSIAHNPFILGNLLVVSYYHEGVVFYNVSDPTNVQEVGFYDTEPGNTNYSGFDGCWGTYPFLPSGRIIASDVLNGLFVLEMSTELQDLANNNNNNCEGTPCDDGNANTYNDMLDASCVCMGTPCVAEAITGLSASNISSNSAELSWNTVAGATYDIRYRQAGTSSWISINGVSASSTVLTGLNPEASYDVRMRSVCESGASPTSSTSFTTTAVQTNYCASQGNNANDEYIGRVQLADIDNVSGAAGYTDHTFVSTDLAAGTAYSVTVTPIWTGAIKNEAYSVWIDYNQDGDFSDAGEQVWTQGNTLASSVSGNFTIPASAVLGSTRMRVSMKHNSGIPTACETFTHGEVEDYTVVIVTVSCPDAGTACDDGDASTFNDVEDGNCDCAGTPCPTVGTTCDDGDASTFNDQEDGNCNCVGTACPTAGTSCDDGNPNTENDVEDGNCGCAGTPIGDCTYTGIDSNDFEAGWGIWNDGGADCRRNANDSHSANSGIFCVRLRDNTSSSVMTTDDLNLNGYEEITIDFTFRPRSMENGEDFWLQISTDGGASYSTVATWVSGTDFTNNVREFETVVIPGSFTSTTRFRFRCDASAKNDIIYIDDVEITGCTYSGLIDDEDTAVNEAVAASVNSLPGNEPTITSTELLANLKLAPNPTRDQLNISFSLTETSEMKLFVTNIAGQQMLTKTIYAEAGSFGTELNTSGYAPGIYFITLTANDQRISQKFVVVE